MTLEPTEPSLPPVADEPQTGEAPNPESLIDLWQSDGVTPPAAWPLPAAPVPETPPAMLPEEGALLSLDELPEPPATFCDAEQEDEEEEEAAGEGEPQSQDLGCQHMPQEETPGRETPPITNGEMAPKDGTPGRGEQVSITVGRAQGVMGGWGDPDNLPPPPRPARATSASPRRRRCPPPRSCRPKPPSPSSTTSPQVSEGSTEGEPVPLWGTPSHPDPLSLSSRDRHHVLGRRPSARGRGELWGGPVSAGPAAGTGSAPRPARGTGGLQPGAGPPSPLWGPAG